MFVMDGFLLVMGGFSMFVMRGFSTFVMGGFSMFVTCLQSVKVLATGKVHRMDLQFVLYGVRNAKEKSGAYLFLPDGQGQVRLAAPPPHHPTSLPSPFLFLCFCSSKYLQMQRSGLEALVAHIVFSRKFCELSVCFPLTVNLPQGKSDSRKNNCSQKGD